MLSANVKNSEIGLYMGVLNSACVIAQFVSGLVTAATITSLGDHALFIVSAVVSAIATIGKINTYE